MKLKKGLCLLLSGVWVLAPTSFQAGHAAGPAARYLVYVGTFGAHGKGIYGFRWRGDEEKPASLGLVAETMNPSFLVPSRDGRYIYAANLDLDHHFNGGTGGSVSAFRVDQATGQLALLDEVSSRGSGPAFISLDHTGRFALVANYSSGSVAVLGIRNDGSLGDSTSVIQHSGSGIDHARQEGPHPHAIQASPDDRFVLATDLGLDELLVYRFDVTTGTLSPAATPFASITPGSGPRHFAFSHNGKFIYVVSEMGSLITVFAFDSQHGTFRSLQTLSTRAENSSGDNTGAEIGVVPSGRFLYASNRGDDTIGVFSIDTHKGLLATVEEVSTEGKTPVMFEIDPDGSHMFVANKRSDSVVIFRIDPKTGRLTATGQVLSVPDPACVRLIPVH